MKNYLLSVMLLTATSIALISCSEGSDGPNCAPVICQNSGTSNGTCGCNCPAGYTGADCSVAKTPTAIIVTSITVTQFPPTFDGHDWDDSAIGNFRNADIYVSLENTTATLYDGSGSTYQDADYLSRYLFTPITPVVIVDVTRLHALLLYNENVGADQLMIAPTFYFYTNGQTEFPTVLTYQDPSGFNFQFNVSYEF